MKRSWRRPREPPSKRSLAKDSAPPGPCATTLSAGPTCIRAEYAGDTLRQAQLAKALAERLSATPDLDTEQREDQVRKVIIESLQTEGVADVSRAQPRSRHSVRCCNRPPDPEHDSAFVQRCNDKTITPLMRQLGVDGDETFTIHHVDSDGCPNQFDLAVQYRGLDAAEQDRHPNGLVLELARATPSEPSDAIGADKKGTFHAEQMLHAFDRPTCVEDCKRAFDVLQREFLFTRKHIWDKKGWLALHGALRSSCRTMGWTLCDGQCSAATPLPSVCKHSASACKVSVTHPVKYPRAPFRHARRSWNVQFGRRRGLRTS